MAQTDNNFIMLPTVDFCFKELMQNENVRKGFIAARLGRPPEEIQETTLIPTALLPENEDDKLGVLDVAVRLKDGTQLDLDMQVIYFAYWTNRVLFYLGRMYTGQLKKLPEKALNEEGIIRWMRFFSGKTREDFREMAETDKYIKEAFGELEKLSADERKRLEYEAREKAMRDYNCLMDSAQELGLKRGWNRDCRKGCSKGYRKDGRDVNPKQKSTPAKCYPVECLLLKSLICWGKTGR